MSKSQDKKKTTKKATKKKATPSGDDGIQFGEDEIDRTGPGDLESDAVDDGSLETGISQRRRQNPPEPEPGPMQLGKTVLIESVQLTVPVAETTMPRVGHLDINLGAKGRRGLQRLTAGCLVSGAKLESGKHVNSGATAARWLIEQIADAK